ncbi:type 2 lanthipeptide synthetase LanM family protein [Streptomyces sp. NPDC088725]|uniref:type 2 lanthipeptide synthetase LanM family protein n=1 Tax=Streptomyces sp. NPDC088725 TaxID=3365873 RepID=UPI0038201B47
MAAHDSDVLATLLTPAPAHRVPPSPAVGRWTDEEERYPFQRVVRGLAVQVCRPERLARHAPLFADPDAIVLELLTRAESRLRHTCTRSLVAALNAAAAHGTLSGDTGNARYLDFVTRHTDAQRLADFPVLRSAVGHLIRNTADAFDEMCERLSADRRLITETFGIGADDPLASIGQADGDSHAHGRSVSVLAFASGARLVHKPRDISCEAAYEEIADHVNRHAGTGLAAARTLARAGYGYVEFVEAEDVADVSPRFMRQCGELAAVLYLLDARDMHFENILATRRGPVPVDLETLLHPARVHVGPRPEAEGNAYDVIAHSLYGIGILPLVMAGKAEGSGHVDLGFLGGANKGTSPFRGLAFENPFTDTMKVVLRAEQAEQRNTVVRSGGEEEMHSLAEEMAQGFADTARALIRDRDAWTALLTRLAGGLRIRYVHNPTALYAQTLRMTASAAAMAAPETTLGLLKRIAIASKTSDPGIIAAELRQMAERDVPYFAAEATGTVLYDADGKDTGARLAETPLDRALRKCRELDETVIARQLTLLYSAFCSRFPDNHLTGTESWQAGHTTSTPGGTRDLARQLADGLVASALPDKFAHLPRTWIGPLASAQAERVWPCGVLGYDLYTGRTGPALALAAAGRVLGDDTYADAARQIFAPSADILAGHRYEQRSVQQTGPGAYTGLTGLLFALDTAGLLLGEPDWRQAARDAVPLAVDQIREDGTGADVISGLAGTATMIAAVGGPHARAVLPRLTEMLCARVETAGGAWSGQSGFAHGVSGVLHALSVLGPNLEDPELRQRADACAGAVLDRLAGFHDADEDNWFSNAAEPGRFSTGWCHGAAGIALALLARAGQDRDDRARSWLDRAVAHTLRDGFGRNLTWCHGDLGNHDVLTEAAVRLGDTRLAERVADLEETRLRPEVFMSKLTDHRSRYAHTTSLMVGTSGVLLHLLNRIEPESRVSPLSLSRGAR